MTWIAQPYCVAHQAESSQGLGNAHVIRAAPQQSTPQCAGGTEQGRPLESNPQLAFARANRQLDGTASPHRCAHRGRAWQA